MSSVKIGFLHPGAMGVSLAAGAIAGGHQACWVGAGRSDATRARAQQHGLTELVSLGTMCEQCNLIVSICPPAAADEVADAVIANNFRGLYLDANAISPMRARSIADRIFKGDACYIDGGVIGGPAWTKDETVLYLSGSRAESAASYFKGGPLATRVIGTKSDQASALKMCYAALTKGSTALLCAVLAAAHTLGVKDELQRQWELDEPGSVERASSRARRVTAKAWRFEGEMHEIADTLAAAGLPEGFHESAAEVFRRMAALKGRDPLPELDEAILRLLDG